MMERIKIRSHDVLLDLSSDFLIDLDDLSAAWHTALPDMIELGDELLDVV